MAGVARIGDLCYGVCTSHIIPRTTIGVVVLGSGDIVTNNRGTARIGDMVISDCGHVGVIIGGSGSVVSNFRGTARLGDVFAGAYTGIIIGGSGTVTGG